MPPNFTKTFKRGRWQLEQERHGLATDTTPPSVEFITSLEQTLPRVMKSLGLEDRYWEQTLVSEWPALVGAQVSQQTRPGRVQRKTLYVFVSHSSWLNELSRYGQKQMLDNIQAKFGTDKIKSLRLQLDPEPR